MPDNNYEPAIEDSNFLHQYIEIMRLTLEQYERAVKRGDMMDVLSSMESMEASARACQVWARHTVRYTKEHGS